MRRSVYRELTTCLLADCRSAVAEFEVSPRNRGIYAFVLECDPFHGALTIGFNTNDGLEQMLRERYPEAKRSDIEGLHGIRYRCSEFAYTNFSLSEETMQLLDEIAATQHDAKTDRTAQRHAEMLLQTLARIVLMLDPDLSGLDLTDDFIAFVSETDADEPSRIALIRKTVSASHFDRVFPEVRAFEEKLKLIANQPISMQAAYWVDAASALAFGVQSGDAQRFRESGQTVSGMLENAATFGSAAVGPLIDGLEKATRKPQLNVSGTQAHGQDGPGAPTSDFAFLLVAAIRTIRLVDEDNLSRIREILGKLLRRDKGKKAGLVAMQLAQLLNELRPHVYPEPQVDAKTKILRNAAAFRAS